MDGKVCKGEEECGERGRPDGQTGLRRNSGDPDRICKTCPFLPTKPGNAPLYLSSLISTAYRMEAILGENAGSVYPNFYTPLEWEAYLTLRYARAKDSDKDLPPQKPKNDAAVRAALGVVR